MGYLFDVLIPALIILGVAFVWLRALLSRVIPPGRSGAPRDPRRANSHPRSLSSSGGYQTETPEYVAPTRNVPAERQWETAESLEDVEKPRSRRTQERASSPRGQAPRPARTAQTTQAQMLARALESPEAVRTGFLIKEILEPPISIRESGRPLDGRA